MDPKITSVNAANIQAPVSDKENIKANKESEANQPITKDQVSISGSSKVKDASGENVKVSVLPQDPAVGPAETIDFPKAKIGKNLSGERVGVDDGSNPKAIADTNGNYFYKVGTPQFDQVNSYTVVYRTLDMYQDLLGHKIDWAFDSPKLSVLPHKQEGKNAYYSRWEESTNFFYFNSKPLNKTVQTSESEDVVSHETGHAVLDGLRPNYMGGFGGVETGAFHEAFGDITAMLLALKDENNLKAILAENNGDFRKESLLSRLAEEFGKAIHLEDSDPKNDNKIYLRSAINNFTYQDPSTLPDGRDDNKLTSEVHNFSRLFTAAAYDVLEGMYKKNLESTPDQLTALKTAGADLSKVFARGVELSPTSKAKYKDVAQAILKADQEITGGKYQDVMKKVFADRKILSGTASAAEKLPELKLDKPLNTKEDALDFVKGSKGRLGISLPDKLKVDSLYTNKNGETFVNYSFTKEAPVKGDGLKKYKDYVTPIYGGLTLAFDSQGKLMSLTNDPVDKEKIKDAMNEIKNYEESGLIMKPRTKLDNVSVFNEEGKLYRAACIPTKGGKKVLQKLPVVD